jgi:hypothetical protein
MQRTFNYTARRKIERKEAIFSFSSEHDSNAEFSVDFRFDDIEQYTESSRLYVEAYYKETRQRFDFGSVSKITPPDSLALTELDLSGGILFDILIVDESSKHGLLLAGGTRFSANDDNKDESNKSSIFDVFVRPLDQLPWKIDIEYDQKPQLILNSNIPNALGKMRTDPLFQGLVLPAALKQVLTYYLWNSEDEEGDEIYQKWLGLALFYNDEKPESTDPGELIAWVDKVVEAFSKRFDLVDKMANGLREE